MVYLLRAWCFATRGARCCRVDGLGKGGGGRVWAWHSLPCLPGKVTQIYSYVGLVLSGNRPHVRVDLSNFTHA